MQLRLPVLFANGLWDRLPVLIPQVGVRALKTARHEFLVDLVDHTAPMGQNFFVAMECPLEPLVLEVLMGLVDRQFAVFVKSLRNALPPDIVPIVASFAAPDPALKCFAMNVRVRRLPDKESDVP